MSEQGIVGDKVAIYIRDEEAVIMVEDCGMHYQAEVTLEELQSYANFINEVLRDKLTESGDNG